MFKFDEILAMREGYDELYAASKEHVDPVDINMEVIFGNICILDLDHTLLYTTFRYYANYPSQEIETRAGTANVMFRPGMSEFITALAKTHDIIIWSAGDDNYVRDIVELIECECEIELPHALSRKDTCHNVDENIYIKNIHRMTICGKPVTEYRELIIIDDNIKGVLTGLEYVYRILPWYTVDPLDTELYKLIETIRARSQ